MFTFISLVLFTFVSYKNRLFCFFTMCDEWKDYVSDPRTVCKYGSKCYQKNPQHHTTYKHPPRNLKNNRGKRALNRFSPYSREEKQNNNETGQERSKEEANVRSQTEENKSLENELNNTHLEENKSDAPPNEQSCSKDHEQSSTSLQQIESNIKYYDPTSNNSIFKELFLVEMPPDFFKFYEFLGGKTGFENTLSSVNLEAIGPFDLLVGRLPKLEDKELYLQHWRFFYDPPEFQAVLKKKGKGEYHIGYFRDDPNEKPVFLAHNDSAKDCHITPMSENIFGAFYLYLENHKKSSPFTAMICQKLMDKVKTYAESNKYNLDEFNTKKRMATVVSKSFHSAGIMVPYNKKTQLGYRRLVESDANIKKLFAKLQAAKTSSEKDCVLSELQPIITYASIAVDECDFGTGIEAGIALFCSGLTELEPPALSSLTAAYSLLNREAFCKIIQEHLKNRRRGPYMSITSWIKK